MSTTLEPSEPLKPLTPLQPLTPVGEADGICGPDGCVIPAATLEG